MCEAQAASRVLPALFGAESTIDHILRARRRIQCSSVDDSRVSSPVI